MLGYKVFLVQNMAIIIRKNPRVYEMYFDPFGMNDALFLDV